MKHVAFALLACLLPSIANAQGCPAGPSQDKCVSKDIKECRRNASAADGKPTTWGFVPTAAAAR
jgi:hypothetical protein